MTTRTKCKETQCAGAASLAWMDRNTVAATGNANAEQKPIVGTQLQLAKGVGIARTPRAAHNQPQNDLGSKNEGKCQHPNDLIAVEKYSTQKF